MPANGSRGSITAPRFWIQVGVEVAPLVRMIEADRVTDLVHQQSDQCEARELDADSELLLRLAKQRRVQLDLASGDDPSIQALAVRQQTVLEELAAGPPETEDRGGVQERGLVAEASEDVDLAAQARPRDRTARIELDCEA